MKPDGSEVRSLTPDQLSRLVMAKKRKREQEGGAADGRIARRAESPAPASFSQQRLWLLDRLEPGSAAYNLSSALRLTGALDPGALARCLTEIARRHGSLRTTFGVADGVPVQIIAPPAPFPLPCIDLAALPDGLAGAEAWRLARAEAASPFDLARGPLTRALLVRRGPGEHLLLVSMHHIVSDGWSFGVLFNEISALYGAFVAGRPSPLPELPVQYTDFAFWQRGQLQGAALQEQLAYWRRQLTGAAPALELATDRLRPPVQTHRGEQRELRIAADLTARLHELSRREGATLFMTLLAAFVLLLHRWAGQDDIVVGAPSAGRQRVETEGLIGFFLNTLVLRTDLAGNPGFTALLDRVREVVLGAYRYQDMPFERLLEELQPERQLSRSPLFQVMFNMVSLPEMRLDLAGLQVEPLASAEPLAKFDFTLYVEESAGEMRCNLVYNSDLFDGGRMAALLDQLHHLLEQIATAPATPIEAFSLLAAETAALLPDPAEPLPDRPWPGPIHERLALHARQSPERVAVADAEESWTYRELAERSSQLAGWLRRSGVAKGDVVAVFAHRSAPLPCAVLGTLKAGAAFLLLDPAYPASRLADYLEIARPTAWLQVPGAGAPPAEVEHALSALALRLRLELPRREGWRHGPHALESPDVEVGPDDLACIGFTSGSTGRPKGVLGRHGPLSQFQPWWRDRFALGAEDRFAMLSALSHDPLQRDILTPVFLGAALEIPDPERMREPGWLAAWAVRRGISVVHLTPAMLELLAGGEEAGILLPDLRWAFVVGDLLRRSEVARLQRIAPALTCVNLYGSTESQRSVSYSVVPPPGVVAGREVLPLGRGIKEVDLLVLNAAGGRAGIGEVGEVYIRSRHLAAGYLGDPELTARRFLPNPFRSKDGDPGDRLYRTGDLGRARLDGEVEFAGRADQQVKIRGFRIEPGEVEAALRRHPGVAECVVVARGEREKRLVAYLVPRGTIGPTARELRAFLGERLPDYMVPAVYVLLEALPLTATGKVDRRALPEPGAEESGEGAAPRLPLENPAEELIAGIWSELLGVAQVGSGDNFFDLGGHSLLATRVLSRVREAFGVEVPLRALFEAPTVAGLAAAVERLRGGGRPQAPPLVPVSALSPETVLPLSFAQQRLWVLDRLEPGGAAFNLPAAVRLQGPLDTAALCRAVAEIVRRHAVLRTAFPEVDGEPRQEVLAASESPVERLDLSLLPEPERAREAARLAAEQSERPFDLARGGLLRAALLRLAADEHMLLLTFHHIVTDGWSTGIFTRELTELYRAFAAGAADLVGAPRPLPELPVQYGDFAVWQRRWLAGEVLAEQLAYWREQLAGAPPVLALPTDRPRPPLQSQRGARRWLTVPRETAGALAAGSRRRGVTLYMTLLAAFAVLLQRLSGEDDLVLGTPIANRVRRELEELIGFFANTLALRIDTSGDLPFEALAGRVRQAALGAYAHQDLPFEKLVEELQPERSLGHAPVFQVMLVLQNAPPPRLELGEVALSPVETYGGRSPLDLTLAMMEIEGELLVRLEYATDLFDGATAERWLGWWGNLLAGVAADPGRRLSELPLLAPAERDEMLAGWNDTAAPLPAEATVDRLLAAGARRRPGAVALACEGVEVTYAELMARASSLAHRLVRLGVGPEVRVGLFLERSPEMVVSLLAVLAAGGAYVPLDPGHPRERLAAILEDAGAAVLLVGEGLAEEDLPPLPEKQRNRVRLLAVGKEDRGAEEPPRALPGGHGAENLAYVIYTSGSTGAPKGVEVRHGGVINYLAAMARHPGLDERDTVLALTTLAFDIAVTELLLPLAVGARIELIGRETAGDAERLAAVIAGAGITCMQATPATWTLLLEGGWAGSPGLKALCGGEALPRALADRLLPRVGSLWNVYGPTETTVWSALGPVPAVWGGGPVPIGRPLANTVIHLLGRAGELAPPGAAGELCIGGAGLARGYHGRPDLTAERFVPDPFAGVADSSGGRRLYRTGDLARRLPGGELEHLGRIDHQVKVRGFRIELGEIEAALVRHPAVAQAAVVVREDGPGERRLVAFTVPVEAGTEPSPGELRSALQERLPDYMLPAAFVPVTALPLSPSGKVDRRLLAAWAAAPGLVRPGAERELVPPRNAAERILAEAWAEVLGLERVGIHDNFFALGGDSILAIRAVTRCQKNGLRFTPRQLFQNQTIAELATVAAVATVAAIAAIPAAAEIRIPAEPAGAGRPEGRAEAEGFVPSDFPLASLSQDDLDDLLADLDEEAGL